LVKVFLPLVVETVLLLLLALVFVSLLSMAMALNTSKSLYFGMKFIEKPMIALAIIFVSMLLLPNYKAAFGYAVSGTEGFITCPKQAPIKIKEWGYSINEGIDLQPNRVGWLTILVPDIPGTTRETNGWITDGRIQGSPGGPHDFVLEGRVVEEGICQPEGPSTATFTILWYCDGS